MGQQEAQFIDSEGDRWYERNKDKPRINRVLECLLRYSITTRKALEIGCSDGRNLAEIRSRLGCAVEGVDPSDEAIAAGKKLYPEIRFIRDTSTYRYLSQAYDLVIYGFCLYLCDRSSVARTVMVGDAALEDGGHLVIHDFDPEYPHKVPYKHVDGLFSYKQDYSKLWLANPAYSLVSKTVIGDGTAVWVLKKNIEGGWPLEITS